MIEPMIEHIMTLLMLTLLQAVLGFDNLLYISIESKRVPEDKQAFVRKWGIGLAILLRIVLLIVVTKAIQHFQDPFLSQHIKAIGFNINMNVHSLIVLVGGAFIIYTAIKEIMHMVADHDLDGTEVDKQRTVGSAIFWIITMNMVFSFDSILSAIALASTPSSDPQSKAQVITQANMVVMTLAVVFSGLMIDLAVRPCQ